MVLHQESSMKQAATRAVYSVVKNKFLQFITESAVFQPTIRRYILEDRSLHLVRIPKKITFIWKPSTELLRVHGSSDIYIRIVSRVLVTYKTGSGLDDWIYCTLYFHNSELQAIQRYRYSTHFPNHRCTRTRVLRLH
jgi:N-glycosylase/DNA lyase